MREVRPALYELTLVRFKEFIRETEAVFWVFAFPVLLTVALGFAFREKAPDKIPVGVIEGPYAQARMKALASSPALLPRRYSEKAGREELRKGKISLLVEGGAVPAYRFGFAMASVVADERRESPSAVVGVVRLHEEEDDVDLAN